MLAGLGSVLGGIAGASLVLALGTPKTGELEKERAPEPSAHARSANESDRQDELAALRARVDSLNRRVSLLTFAQEHRSPTTADDNRQDAGRETPEKSVDDPVFEAAVRDVIDQVDEERDAQRDARRAERRTEWTKRWIVSLGDQLALRPDQAARIEAIVGEHVEAMRALRNSDGDAGPVLRSEWRRRVKEISDQSEQKLGSVLDPSQKAKYDALDEADKLGGRGWGRGSG